MRHGEADTFGLKDSQRCLTPNGIQQAKVAGNWLSQYVGKDRLIDLAIVSSFQRAQQSYQEVSHSINCVREETSEDVIPSADPKLAHDYIDTLLAQNSHLEHILVVTHMPFVCYFLQDITTNQCAMLFDTSSIVVVDYNVEQQMGVVETIYHPQ